jgi:hypothetical protein
MKRSILLLTILAIVALKLSAQDEKEEKDKGFKKENLFTGGSITASFFSGGTILGANPMFGYQLANWVDAGIALNYTYAGAKDGFGNKVRQNVFGGGVFTRLYPVKFLFLQGQFEHNFTNLNYIYTDGTRIKDKTDANSLLIGAGIAEGRQRGSNSFFYISVLFDVLKNPSSPYVDNVYDQYTRQVLRTDIIPIVRAGVNIGLFQGHYNNERGNGRRQPRSYNGY